MLSLLFTWPRVISINSMPIESPVKQQSGFTCILVIVDRFSKACRLIALKGLPTAMETAALFNIVFCNFGLPEDMVSDHGPQIIFCVCKAFFSFLGVTDSPQDSILRRMGRHRGKFMTFPENLLPWPPHLLEPFPGLGRIRPKLPPSACNWTH